MGYTEEDARADMHDMVTAEEVAEDYYRGLFGDEVTANELNSYAVWLAPGLAAAEALNKSGSRAVICTAMAGMPDFMIDHERDDHLELPGVNMLETIVPPSGHPSWAPYGRPTTLFHQLHRMEGDDKNGKPVDLITVRYEEVNRMGGQMKAYKLTRTGICYAHIHGRGVVSKDDLVRYWRHETQGVEVAATNPYYLAMTDQAPPPDDSIYQYETGGSVPWGVLASLMREDATVPERYRDHSGNKLSQGLSNVYADEAAEAMKFLTKEDQRALCHDVLLHSKVDNLAVREDFIDGLYAEKVTYKDRVEKLVKTYEGAHPDADADQIIGELICRATWAVISRVMDFRMADDYESAMRHPHNQVRDQAAMTEERLLEAIQNFESAKAALANRVGAQQSGYEGEWEIDHPAARRP
jgi:hypothetical protein